MQGDFVRTFQIEGANLRGRVVTLTDVADTILTRHAYPQPVSHLLGEALGLTALLSSALKFEGIFTLQIKGSGPISTLVSDLRTPGDLRGYAGFDPEALKDAMTADGPSGMVPRYLGAGHLAFTVDQGENTERYQGIVELVGSALTDCVYGYFQQSEQLQTGMRVVATQTPDPEGAPRWRVGGIMLQRLPPTGGPEEIDAADDAWLEALALIGTLTDRELIDPRLSDESLLYRLFHQQGVRVFDAHPLGCACRCSREKVSRVLHSLPETEVNDMAIDGHIIVTCQFCNVSYPFSAEEFAAQSQQGTHE